MNAADRLIVALDGHTGNMGRIVAAMYRDVGVAFFKVGVSTLLQPGGYDLCRTINKLGLTSLFLDIKLYDVRDTVQPVIRQAFEDLGARFVTVHATPSVMEAAMRAKPADPRCKVLAIGPTSDIQVSYNGDLIPEVEATIRGLDECDGAVMSGRLLQAYKREYGLRKGKIVVAPGIRLPAKTSEGWDDMVAPRDDHNYPLRPSEALAAGADYLVVGRPIYASADPVAAARAIIAEMEAAA
jgi:orotidine-5'-phosphate decarboxylase